MVTSGGMATSEVAVKDVHGSVFLSAVSTTPLPFGRLQAEVQVILFGLKLAIDYCFHLFIVQSDSLMRISKIRGELASDWDGECLILDIVDLTSSCTTCFFVFVSNN